MADDLDDGELRLDDEPGQLLDEANNLPETTRIDLFGDADSDAEDEAPPTAPAEAEASPAKRQAPPEEAQDDAEQATAREKSPEEAAAAEGEDGQPQGGHSDIFASDSEDEGGQRGYVSEAEEEDEEDEFEALFKTGKKRKRPKGQTAEIVMTVETLIANMEVAAEMDIAANEEGKPAVNKLKMLPTVEDKLSQSLLHRELLDGGILGALKLWLEPLPNGSLPNVKVRSAVLGLLHKLPIDLSMEGRKEQLKKSELGKYVMFYSKLPDETLPNRQVARGLVEKWSRPIFEQFRERAQDDEIQEREAQLARLRKQRRLQSAAPTPAKEPAKNLKPGDPGFRWHARVPEPARLDYLKLPESSLPADAAPAAAVKGKAKPKDKMSKKLAAMSRKGTARGEGKVSLQGRGLLM